tara:strand:+ start:3183 stop:3410 length:228 start_codon:yes stop_codon:yes gene_type:complete
MPSLNERIAAVDRELSSIIAEAKMGPKVLDEIGHLGMAQYFTQRAVERAQERRQLIAHLAGQAGGLDHSLPAGDQ